MKTTYLVFENGVGSALRVASKEEWKRIMEENRNLPRELRRFFVQDCFEDCGWMDCLYIESSREEYDKWHAENQRKYRQRTDCGEVEILSLDVSVVTEDESSMLDVMPDGVDWEDVILDGLRVREFRKSLAEWKVWANELLDYYLDGQQLAATKILAEKYGVSEQIIRRRKRMLEDYVRSYFNVA